MPFAPTINAALKQRLNDEIERLEKEISIINHQGRLKMSETLIATLNKAKKFNQKREFESGWNHLHIAEQLLVSDMDKDEIQAKSDKLRIEALDKIRGFRRDQIIFFLGAEASNDKTKYSKERLLEAMKVYADYYDTRNHRLALHKASVFTISFISGLILAIILLLSYTEGLKINNLSYGLVMSGLFGLLGASFSIVRSFLSFKLDSKIPEQIVNTTVTGIRLIVGAISAMIFYLVIHSGVFDNIFSEKIVKSDLAYIIYSFIAGYSERWTTKILDLIAKDNGNTVQEAREPEKEGTSGQTNKKG